MTNERTFISTSGNDNQTRLATVEAVAIMDAIYSLETALIGGQKNGTGYTAGVHKYVQDKLSEAFQANIMRKASMQMIKDDGKYDEAEQKAKDKFTKLLQMREKGLL